MTIESQVCTLQQAKWLKELGVVQEALFYWMPDPNDEATKITYKLPDYFLVYGDKQMPSKEGTTVKQNVLEGRFRKTFAAFTVAELGVMLPDYYASWRGRQGKWYCAHVEDQEYNFLCLQTEAMVKSALLIRLLQGGEITAEEVNTRLSATNLPQ